VQHAIDFAEGGATEAEVYAAAERHGIFGEETTNDWWHRRVFTREIQNTLSNNYGMGILKPYLSDIYEAYQAVGGRLTLPEIASTIFKGLY